MSGHAGMSTTMAAVPAVRPKRSASDWLGCLFFAAFALTLPLTSGTSGLLLLPPMIYEMVVAVTFLMRGRARRSLHGVGPRAAAYGATFLLPIFLWTAQRWAPHLVAVSTVPWFVRAGAGIWLFGSVVGFWPIWYMRHSFSIEPAARELATDGPYRLARHPIYASQILMYVGIFLLHATMVFALALVTWFVVLHVRVEYEERVLNEEYPEYERYRRRVGAFWPRFVVRQTAQTG